MKGLTWLVIIIILLGGIYFFMSRDEEVSTNDDGTSMIDDQTMNEDEMMSDDSMEETSDSSSNGDEMTDSQIQEFVVEGSSFKYAPNRIEVKKGQPVTIVFKNVGGFHDWVIDEFDASTSQIREGETETITFTPDKVGSFEYYCSVGNHRAQGMVGTLIVTE